MSIINFTIHIASLIIATAFIWFAILSIYEKEYRAVKRSVVLGACISLTLEACLFLPAEYQYIIVGFILIFLIYFIALFLIPNKCKEDPVVNCGFQFDERDSMFSRLEISNNEMLSNRYYKINPGKLKLDKLWLNKPGLLSPESKLYDNKAFSAAEASFRVIGEFKSKVSPTPNNVMSNTDAKEISDFIKTWGKKLGAIDVGFCEMKPQHFYSVRGRGDEYGKKVINRHKFGIALTVEMDKDFLSTGPYAPTIMESALQYVNSGIIAMQITYFLSQLGYSVRSHIDGNYEVICPLVARDCGLGEIGRMGLLMTPKLGPRVRIAVITTDAPIIPSKRNYDPSVEKFCSICSKCASLCPGKAIPKFEKAEINGVKRWQIIQERCFSYWCTTGTDCGRCMSICPFSHPTNIIHNFVRWGIKKSATFRLFALKMDTFFYGSKPKPSNPEKLF